MKDAEWSRLERGVRRIVSNAQDEVLIRNLAKSLHSSCIRILQVVESMGDVIVNVGDGTANGYYLREHICDYGVEWGE